MMYYLLTWINLFGGLYASCLLISLAKNYVITHRMQVYLMLTLGAMFYLIVTQAYTLTGDSGAWKLKVAAMFWWSKTVYFVWAFKSTALKKDGKGNDVRFTNYKN